MQYLIFLGAVDTDVLGSTEITYLRIETRKLRYFNEGAEAFLLNDFVGDGKLVVCTLLGKYSCPRIKAVDALLLESLWTQVFEEEIKFR